jgi:adenylate cyclase
VDAGEHTFLFTDLVGFTALTAERGDDHGADTAIAFYERVRPLLAGHTAEEVKTLGDGMMLRAPDPGSGIRLGVAIVRECERIPGFPPVRVGVHHGPAVCRGGDWFGDTVNVASRLCSAAAGGEVLVSEKARDAARGLSRVGFGERRLHWLKNVSRPIHAQVAAECAALGLSPEIAA